MPTVYERRDGREDVWFCKITCDDCGAVYDDGRSA